MIHDRYYYTIVDMGKILSLLDNIDQKVIWMFHRNFIWDNQLIPISMGHDIGTPWYLEVLSNRNIAHMRYSEGQQEDYTSVLLLDYIDWNIDDVEG